jgi:N-acetylmuramoyl-L-alanine amidase
MKTLALLLIGAATALPSAAHAKARRPKAKTTTAAAPAPIIPLHPPRISTEPVTFVWPPEGLAFTADGEFVLGNVDDARARLTINGATVTVHKDGGFLAFLPISVGTFSFRAELARSSGVAVAERHIYVPPAPAPLPDGTPVIDRASLWPKADLDLRAGDWWTVRMKATRGQSARFRVGEGPWHALSEVNPRLGIYEAVLQAPAGESAPPSVVEYQLGSGWSALSAKGTARVSLRAKALGVATVKPNSAGFANIKTGPTDGFMLFPPAGARFVVTGRDGDFLRAELSSTLAGWIDAKDVELSTSAAPPRAETGNVSVLESPAGAVVKISLTERVPFDVLESDAQDMVLVRVFSSVGHTNIVGFEGGSEFVDQVRWRQEATGVTTFTVRLKAGRKLWGWNARYDGGASLRLDLRRPPKVNPKRPLEGIKVMLDPGHMPSAPGASGPLATKEMDANFAIAEAAAQRLRLLGAIPLLTRATTTDEVSLTDRPKQAVERGADLFVSIHNNALPDGANPFSRPRGYTVFYYHPHSQALGRAVHAAYVRSIPLPDEGLQWDNLLVARLSAMPSILVENAHMIIPEQEAYLNDPAFRGKLADAIVAGLKAFLLEAGEKASR